MRNTDRGDIGVKREVVAITWVVEGHNITAVIGTGIDSTEISRNGAGRSKRRSSCA